MKNQKEIKESISFTTATKRIKYLGINLPKDTKELYTENYDTNERKLQQNFRGASLVAQRLKCLPAMRETRVLSLDWEDPLEKEMVTRSNILAWRIP